MRTVNVLTFGLISALACCLTACATKAAYSDLAAEQERCAGYWGRSGDPDRAQELRRRSMESRHAASQVSGSEDFFGDLLVLLLGGRDPNVKPIKQDPHPSDSRGRE
jgi:hypothetical protein